MEIQLSCISDRETILRGQKKTVPNLVRYEPTVFPIGAVLQPLAKLESQSHHVEFVFAFDESIRNKICGSGHPGSQRRIGFGPDFLLPDVLFQGQRIRNRNDRTDLPDEGVSGPSARLGFGVDQLEDRVRAQPQDGQRESGHFEARHESAGKNSVHFHRELFGQLLDGLVDEDAHLQVGDRAQVVEHRDHLVATLKGKPVKLSNCGSEGV